MSGKALSQKERILKILQSGKRLSQAQARRRNIKSLSSRVSELRHHDHVPITSVPMVGRTGRTVVYYELA